MAYQFYLIFLCIIIVKEIFFKVMVGSQPQLLGPQLWEVLQAKEDLTLEDLTLEDLILAVHLVI